MALAVAADPTPLRTDEHGVVRVGDTRVTLSSIVRSYQRGDTPEAIHEGFPSVPLADVFATITYYLRHQEEVDAYLADEDAEAEHIRRQIEADYPPEFREKLRKLRDLRDSSR